MLDQTAPRGGQPRSRAERRRASRAARKLSGKETALLVATVCSSPPTGRKRWTLEPLAGPVVGLMDDQGLSRETARRRLAEDDLKPWLRKVWCIPLGGQDIDSPSKSKSQARYFHCVFALSSDLRETNWAAGEYFAVRQK